VCRARVDGYRDVLCASETSASIHAQRPCFFPSLLLSHSLSIASEFRAVSAKLNSSLSRARLHFSPGEERAPPPPRLGKLLRARRSRWWASLAASLTLLSSFLPSGASARFPAHRLAVGKKTRACLVVKFSLPSPLREPCRQDCPALLFLPAAVSLVHLCRVPIDLETPAALPPFALSRLGARAGHESPRWRMTIRREDFIRFAIFHPRMLRGTLIDCVMRYALIKRRSAPRFPLEMFPAHEPGILFETRTKGPAD